MRMKKVCWAAGIALAVLAVGLVRTETRAGESPESAVDPAEGTDLPAAASFPYPHGMVNTVTLIDGKVAVTMSWSRGSACEFFAGADRLTYEPGVPSAGYVFNLAWRGRTLFLANSFSVQMLEFPLPAGSAPRYLGGVMLGFPQGGADRVYDDHGELLWVMTNEGARVLRFGPAGTRPELCAWLPVLTTPAAFAAYRGTGVWVDRKEPAVLRVAVLPGAAGDDSARAAVTDGFRLPSPARQLVFDGEGALYVQTAAGELLSGSGEKLAVGVSGLTGRDGDIRYFVAGPDHSAELVVRRGGTVLRYPVTADMSKARYEVDSRSGLLAWLDPAAGLRTAQLQVGRAPVPLGYSPIISSEGPVVARNGYAYSVCPLGNASWQLYGFRITPTAAEPERKTANFEVYEPYPVDPRQRLDGYDNVLPGGLMAFYGKYLLVPGGLFDVSDPARPRYLRETGPVASALLTRGTLLFRASAREIRIDDLAALPEIRPLAVIGPSAQIKRYQTLEVDGEYLYAFGSGALAVYRVSDPAHPELLGEIAIPGCNPLAVRKIGSYLYAPARNGKLFILDVSAPAAVKVAAALPSFLAGQTGSVGFQRGLLWLADGNRIGAWDLTDPLAPRRVRSCAGPDSGFGTYTYFDFDGDRLIAKPYSRFDIWNLN